MAERILLIEDDIHIASLVQLHLQEASYQVTVIADGAKALNEFARQTYALVIVDLMLPGIDGKEIIKRIRLVNTDVPILITTVKSDLMHKVIGFELGADDYLAKPFNVEELVVRVKAMLRRSTASPINQQAEPLLELGDVKVDLHRRKVFVKQSEIQLSPKLFDLLVFMMKHPGRPYSRAELLAHVWDYGHEGYDHTVDTHINRLRGKIEPNVSKPLYVITVWGVGYRFAEAHELKK